MKTCWGFLLMFLNRVSGELRAVNIFGLETDLRNIMCCWVKPVDYYLDQLQVFGFNSIRLPFSAQYVQENDFTVMDQVVNKATELNMSIILDYHRTYNDHQGDWYEISLDPFLGTWIKVAGRYVDAPSVQYLDLYNEFQQPNNPQTVSFWNDIMDQSILRLDKQFPDRYTYIVGGTNWGGNLNGIHVEHDRVLYSIHKYQFSKLGDDYRKDYDVSFGNHPPDKIFVGEFGWIQERPEQVEWASFFLSYLKEKGINNTAFWNMVFQSGDTHGIYKENCLDIETEKITMLHHFWYNNDLNSI